MIKGTHHAITGLALSVLVGGTWQLPTYAQASAPLPTSVPGSSDPIAPLPNSPIPPLPNSPIPPLPNSPLTSPSVSPIGPVQSGQPQIETSYTLGAGDLVRIDIFDTPELTLEQRYTVLLDGTVNLPWVGSVNIQNLTLAQASRTISDRYKRFIRDPIITVGLVAPRPLKVGIIGEINRPGSYIINVIGSETPQTALVQRGTFESGSQWPTVSKAIQTAGGISETANLRRIEIRRPRLGATEQVIAVDLWRYLDQGDLSQDVLLRDGDTIMVPKATSLDPAEATQIAISNFSRELIKVNVVGEVVAPGAVSIRPNTTLNQAILAAGGLKNTRARKSNVELIRLNPNGTVSRQRIAIDFSKGLSDAGNPPLHNNDTVIVNRNGLANVSDILGAVLTPVTGALGLLNLLGL